MRRQRRIALFLICCLCGCNRPNAVAPPRQGEAPAQEPSRAEALKAALIGQWRSVGGESMEVGADGGLTIAPVGRPAVTGKYTILEDGQVLVDLRPAIAEPFKASAALAGDELTVAAQVKTKDHLDFEHVQERKSMWTRAAADSPAPDAGPTGAAMVGRWKSAADEETYDLFGDGTFAHYAPGDVLDYVTLGTWKAPARPSNYVNCTYPDSGRTEAIFAVGSGGDMVIGRDDPNCPVGLLRDAKTYRRLGDPAPERKPIQPGPFTAYQLFQEFKANPEEAERKYKGKEFEIAGVVQSISSGSSSFVIAAKDKSVDEGVSGTTLTLSTGEQENVLCTFPGLMVDIFDHSKVNPLHRCASITVKGTCLGLGKQQGFFTIGGDEPKVRFEKCKLIPAAPKTGDK